MRDHRVAFRDDVEELHREVWECLSERTDPDSSGLSHRAIGNFIERFEVLVIDRVDEKPNQLFVRLEIDVGWIDEQLELDVVRVTEDEDGGTGDGVGPRDRGMRDGSGGEPPLPTRPAPCGLTQRTRGGRAPLESRRTRPDCRPCARSDPPAPVSRCGGGTPCAAPHQANRTRRPSGSQGCPRTRPRSRLHRAR
jgi:hypothetical protein